MERATGTPRVLIVERDQNVRALQSYFLERAGYSIDFADDGQVALASARLTPPALVITEILIAKIDE